MKTSDMGDVIGNIALLKRILYTFRKLN